MVVMVLQALVKNLVAHLLLAAFLQANQSDMAKSVTRISDEIKSAIDEITVFESVVNVGNAVIEEQVVIVETTWKVNLRMCHWQLVCQCSAGCAIISRSTGRQAASGTSFGLLLLQNTNNLPSRVSTLCYYFI